MNQNFSTISNL